MADITYDIEYEGWAPCTHSEEDKAKAVEWLDRIAGASQVSHYAFVGGRLEELLWRINQLGGQPTMDCDQWVAVGTCGSIASKKIHTYIQGDTFLLAAAETYRWWRDKHKELTGEDE